MIPFCNSPLWDHERIWNTTDPDLTECFQHTVLVLLPCAFLWIVFPIIMFQYKKLKDISTKWTILAVIKIVVAVLLCFICIWRLAYLIYLTASYNDEYGSSVSSFVAEIFRIGTFCLSAYLINTERKKKITSSGYNFIFWLMMTVCGVVEFRSHLKRALHEHAYNRFLFGTVMAYYPLVFAQLCLHCFADEDRAARQIRKLHWPEYHSSFPSRLLFSWFSGLVYKGWRRPLIQSDLWELDTPDKTAVTVRKFEEHWKQEVERGKNGAYQPSIMKALGKTYWKLMLMTGFLQLLSTVILQTVALPFALRYIIWFVSAPHVEMWKGYFVAIALFLISVGFSIFLAHFYHCGALISLRMRSALVGCIYKKSLKISADARREKSAAEIVNLMAVDAQRFTLSPIHVHSLWGCVVQIVIAVVLLYQIIGPSVFAGIGAMLLTIPLVGSVMRRNRVLEAAQLEEKDQRMKVMHEILNGIKILKLYAWEESFENKVETVRNKELVALRKSANLKAINMITWLFTPSLVAVVSYTCYVLSDDHNILNPAKTFVSLALFSILRLPLALLPAAITGIIQSALSLKRISSFLLSEELDPHNVTYLPANDNQITSAISLQSASFAFGKKDSEPVLRDINLDIVPGTLTAVVGPVGSGKSSICSAIIGTLEKLSGSVYVKGKLAYCSQSAWIQNRTVKENILFGLPYDEAKYAEAIEVTALQPDLDILPAGDDTEIGERGINLSGGQKQRINIARAIYANADVYLLDDPLSAVDAHVAKHIFDNVIGPRGVLRNKTRIFVTHAAHFLPQCDRIVFIRHGEISAFADFSRLIQSVDFSEFHENLKTRAETEALTDEVEDKILPVLTDVDEDAPPPITKNRAGSGSEAFEMQDKNQPVGQNIRRVHTTSGSDAPSSVKGENSKLIIEEHAEVGKVRWKIYATLLKYASGVATFITVLSHAIYTGFVLAANVWLSVWSEDNMTMPDGGVNTQLRDYRLGIYALLNFFQAIFIYISALVLALSCVRASRRLHSEMLHRLLRAPLSFFESTPVGRIVNRFSRDLDTLDNQLPAHFKMWLNGLFILISVLILICISTPIFAAVVPVVAILYVLIQKAFVPSSRQIKRLESVSRSPILSHFQESLNGRQVILAMNQEDRFIDINSHLNDIHNTSSYANAVGQRWILVRVEALGSLCVFFAALFAVIGKGHWESHPGLLGLAITYATTMTSSFNWLVRTSSDIEANAVSVERMQEYTQIQQEASWHIPSRKPKDNWPEHGKVEFYNYGLRYRENLDLVLENITCTISGGERIGVCGRTGAGKTSLISALFRLLEPATGIIKIDDLDITQLGLHDVRSRLTIIPQDPVLFNGTLRSNLDPFGKHSDAEIWSALELSYLKEFAQNKSAKLDLPIAESGDNLSVGQRQLVCLARALLRKSRILILDEATASIDLECDELIQTAIHKEFSHCTVITVAHRLNTIMNYDRIMVLENGKIQEFDTPNNLLMNKDSLFYALAKTANLAH
ncbi:LOW QUALITY PROTEIN: multidrug resistance-associated protein 1-like [Paramacrobiotus metropolitanus]|uniref:LOW QUALITY PROTEIN: multidrug resistance-associated protein 1-like n=1 Tax=Paramacrobiotus metropolitanus TaxID=2943436 RepID=UPI002445B637|nr:LOW QUALITY PROTEIN: multidrug resistance-associated protein 1-like [Paramacrobiotus metropolitanus]